MIIDPREVLKKKWITFPDKPVQDSQFQPNGIDLRLRTATPILSNDGKHFELLENQTTHLDSSEECAVAYVEEDKRRIFFQKLVPFRVETYEYINVPETAIAIIYGRSSLNRNGILARASIYDSGFKGYAGFTLYPFMPMVAHQGIRIAQIVFIEASSSVVYKGQYGD